MTRYFLLRIALFVPSFLIICLVAFGLYKMAPGDPVEAILDVRGVSQSSDIINKNYQSEYIKVALELGLNKPEFYFAFTPSYYPDTLYRISNVGFKERVKILLNQARNWNQLNNYLTSEEKLCNIVDTLILPDRTLKNRLSYSVDALKNEKKLNLISSHLDQISSLSETLEIAEFHESLQQVKLDYNNVRDKTENSLFFPTVHWYGINNQFHDWVANLISLDFGISLQDGGYVSKKLSAALIWTISMTGIAILLSFLFSIPIGLYSAKWENGIFDKVVGVFLYVIYGMPLFWFATLMVVFFTTSEYGIWTDIFPSVGIRITGEGVGNLERLWINASRLILPIFCLTIHSLSYLSRQIRNSMINEKKNNYSLTARAKGLKENQVLWKHNLPNSMLPLITILFGMIPSGLTGSLIIEIIFNIPGMGRLMFDSIFNNDWPVVYAALFVFALATMISYTLADLAYVKVDPRIKYQAT